MKMPRVFSNGIAKWSLVALVPLLVAATFIAASEGPDAQQGFTVGAATRFVMFDETSKGEAGEIPPEKFVAPDATKLGEFDGVRLQFGTPAAYEEAPDSEPAPPVIRPALAPTLLPTAGEVGQAADATRFVASDQVEEFELRQASRYTTEGLSFDIATSPAASGFAESVPLFGDPSEPVVRESHNPFVDQGRFSMTVPDAQVAQAPAVEEGGMLPASSAIETPQGFSMEDDPASTPVNGGVGAPQISTEHSGAPSSQLTRLPNPDEQPVAARMAVSQADAGSVPYAATPTSNQLESPAAIIPEPEAAVDQYEFAPEDPYFAEPAMAADCGMACPRTWYAKAEAMYMQRVSQNQVTMTINTDDYSGSLDRFDFRPGGRITIGRIGDCLDGVELVYTGVTDWTENSLLRGDDLNVRFESDIFDLSTFNNAQVHRQEYRSDFHSIELNKKWWGWDVISTSVGLRFIYVREEYQFDSHNEIEGDGTFDLDMKNNLLGPQVGLDLYRSLGRWTGAIESKAGVYVNYIEGNAGLVNAGEREFSIGDEKGQLGFEAEIGFHAKYQLLPRVNLQAGYEFWYLYGVATGTSQHSARLSRKRYLDSKGEVFYHGGSVGVEVVW